MRRAYMVVCLAVLVGCAGQEARRGLDQIEQMLTRARRNGAYRCAPKHLALAEAHLQRARDEFDLGNYMPALKHREKADEHARLAYANSPPDKCADEDSDHDGLLDRVDQCPQDPEDRDGFEDEDGCPDLDNDQDGIPDERDQCPNHAEDKDGFEDHDGCPESDNDADRIPDASDSCPDRPEDYDGFEDEDGCPDLDNDGDKIVDREDKCPNQPEDYDGDQDTDGCPDKYKLVRVTENRIELKQKVFFATAKARIRRRSFKLLREVAQVLRDRPSVHVRIEGHTDSRGSARYNKRLSDARANSVRAFLIREGIAAERMEAAGLGEGTPVADNRTRAGRALNRRVEFHIVKQ